MQRTVFCAFSDDPHHQGGPSVWVDLRKPEWQYRKLIKGLCDVSTSGFSVGNVNEHGHLDVYRSTVYNPQSDRDNNKTHWGQGYFTLRNSQEYRQSHDPVGYKKLESFQEQLYIYQNY